MRRLILAVLHSVFLPSSGLQLVADEGSLPPGLKGLLTPLPKTKLTKEEAVARAKEIIFPELQLRDMTAAEAIMEVRAKAMKLSEGKPGLEIGLTTEVYLEGKAPLTLEFKEVSLYDVLEKIAKQTGFILSFEDGTAAFWTKEGLAYSKVVLTDAQKAWLKRGEEIIIPKFEVKAALLPDVIKLLNSEAKAADPKKKGWPVELSPGAKASKTELTITLEGQSASAVLNLVLELSNLRRKVTESKVILSTLGEG